MVKLLEPSLCWSGSGLEGPDILFGDSLRVGGEPGVVDRSSCCCCFSRLRSRGIMMERVVGFRIDSQTSVGYSVPSTFEREELLAAPHLGFGRLGG